jgi:type VI secretion system protein ImpH
MGQRAPPVDEPVRLGQDPDLSFAPAPLSSFEIGSDGQPPVAGPPVGLLGPNGPLPLHLTEFARERLRNAGDPTFSRFLDLFHHRFLALFYRAWAQAQPHVSRDRPAEDRFPSTWVRSPVCPRRRSAIATRSRTLPSSFTSAPHPSRANAEGLAAIIEHFFRYPHESNSSSATGCSFASTSARVSDAGAMLAPGGRRRGVWDRQHKFRIHLGPLTLEHTKAFCPEAG